VLPDLAPAPPLDLRTQKLKGRWYVEFSSILVNVGDGEFLLRAKRPGEGAAWVVEQDIPYSKSGAKVMPLDMTLVWGGDGHNHWHVPDVATNQLIPLDAQGRAVAAKYRVDAKVGFCFFDYEHRLRFGPEKAAHHRQTCGHKDDNVVGMGLSPGWSDNYEFVLPGQRIDISGLKDGKYRLEAEADIKHKFREVTRANNITWADFELSTREDGIRLALVVDSGPQPR
jgi:Lysyl oxidase